MPLFDPDPNSQLIDSPPPIPTLDENSAEGQPKDLDTQALWDSNTQMPDLALAEPDGGWDTLDTLPSIPSSSPRIINQRSSPYLPQRAVSPPPAPELIQSAIESFCDKHVMAGYAFVDCIASIKATCLNLPLAEYVLRYLTKKKGVPKFETGIWTKDDDDDLNAMDARRVNKVYEKHGEGSGEKRWEFLSLWEQTGLED